MLVHKSFRYGLESDVQTLECVLQGEARGSLIGDGQRAQGGLLV